MPFTDNEIRVSRSTLGIAVLAALAFGLIGVDLALPRDDIGYLSLPFFVSAALVRIRRFFCQLHHQWQAAFDMGVSVGRAQEREDAQHQTQVRPLR